MPDDLLAPYREQLRRYRRIVERVQTASVSRYRSVVAETRRGGEDADARAAADGARPVRVPVRKDATLELHEVHECMMKTYERHLRAQAFRERRYARKDV
jgi:hypothetical protein